MKMLEIANAISCSVLTVDASNFRSQTNGNTFGIGGVTVGYACESFFNAHLGANFIQFEISENHHVIFH